MTDPKDRFHILIVPTAVKGKKGRVLQREHGKCRHESIRNWVSTLPEPAIRELFGSHSNGLDERIEGEMLARSRQIGSCGKATH
jgi:hypothetical protein